ncbi:tRNA glutamyl-Q(34) synthetase GluQRS [Parenemella sanctibonifatiensis]|uniref:tRNA glutamyl-Q(34) synthetase GluQRS n=1 Tax=Parenemella sanctibonifatiensis TaxID=2016505 RepID=A0A255EEP0_9ACTN|nr:tRNA glutamyl-Q(34) synthetase GluQRS [Parenemella sanctibonifatiensis]OYN90018.1 tRNA glutamyl-Q(34) synthetase GluQRS [Parenemella sanctibonifatiensis]
MAGYGRFAPSPSGRLHVGNLRTALAARQLAEATGRGFLVRMEDLDQLRSADADTIGAGQLADLAAIGVISDVTVLWQRDRLSAYAAAVAELAPLTYECFCTRAEIRAASRAPHGAQRPYPGTCRDLTDAERDRRRRDRPAALRVRSGDQWISFDDRWQGEQRAFVDDFVVRRNDGGFAYNLAVVLDDAWQQVSQVVRGADLMESTGRQIWLQRQLGLPEPEWAHVGLVLNSDGVRLAKRDGAVDLGELAELGISAEQVRAGLVRSLGGPGEPIGPASGANAAGPGQTWVWHGPGSLS